jgi:hypothetical protein
MSEIDGDYNYYFTVSTSSKIWFKLYLNPDLCNGLSKIKDEYSNIEKLIEKKNGLGRIRTGDLRRVRATS